MLFPGKIVRCCGVIDAVGLTYRKHYTVMAAQDGWVTVVDDLGVASRFPEERFQPVEAETLADTGNLDVRQPPTNPAADRRPIAVANPIPNGDRQVILLVDDNPRLRAATAEQLRRLNYIVEEAENAAQAMGHLQTDQTIELLFTDIVMPGGISGFDLARTCATRWPDLKILLTTGFPLARQDTNEPPSLGWPLIGKPYRIRELALQIADLLQRPNPPVEARLYSAQA